MSDLIDIPAALVVSPRPCAPLAGARLNAVDAQPRLVALASMPSARAAWRHLDGSDERGLEMAAGHQAHDGRTAFTGGTYVTTHQFSTQRTTRSGPPTSRPPA